MKNRLQTMMQAERERLGDAGMQRRFQDWVESSDSPLAVWWRAIRRVEQAEKNRHGK
jgi:hypothetical protein